MKRAFTLVELILYITLLTIVLLGVALFLTGNTEQHVRSAVSIDLGRTLATMTDHLTRTMARGDTLNIDDSLFENDMGRLSFTTANGDTIAIERTAENAATITENTDDPLPLHPTTIHTTQLRFTNISSPKSFPVIRAHITIEAANPSEIILRDNSVTTSLTIPFRQTIP